jgi:putative toxin-antitoxin system antitoxin component (TIGR02293 family)
VSYFVGGPVEGSTFARYKPSRNPEDSFWVKIGVEDQQTDRIAAVHQGFYTQVYHHLVKKAALSQAEFAHVTAIPVSTLKRRLKQDNRFTTTESDVMYRLAALIKQATELFAGDEQKAQNWLQTKVYGLNNKRPIDMVATSVDFKVVEDLIGRVRHGIVT